MKFVYMSLHMIIREERKTQKNYTRILTSTSIIIYDYKRREEDTKNYITKSKKNLIREVHFFSSFIIPSDIIDQNKLVHLCTVNRIVK
jgi:hypothetical protein